MSWVHHAVTAAANLAATDAHAQSTKGAGFARLAAVDQDSVLTDMVKWGKRRRSA
jgi:hypothetical protein